MFYFSVDNLFLLCYTNDMVQTNYEMKKNNTLKVFKALKEHGALSRREIENVTGLSWGTVSTVTGDLLSRGFIVAQKQATGAGRPHSLLTVSESEYLLLGVDINSVGLSFNVVNLGGTSVFSEFCPIESRNKNDLLCLLLEKTTQIINTFPVLSICLSMQGKIDRKNGVSVRTNFFEDWKDVPLVQFFRENFSLPTYLYHDPECLLTFHLQNDIRLKGLQNGLMIRIDDGIGMAQTIGNTLYESEEGADCELGHTVIVPNGKPCVCGKKGCLEAYASLRGMKRLLGEEKEDIIPRLNAKSERIVSLREQATSYLGMSIANLFTLFSPSFILIDGIAADKIDGFYEEIKAKTEDFLGATGCPLFKAKHQPSAAAIGACLLTIEKRLEEIIFP